MRISGTDIYISQGDGAKLTVNVNGDFDAAKMRFSFEIDTNINFIEIDEPFSNEVVFEINREFLRGIDPGEYFYDIIVEKDEKQKTIIKKSLFVIEKTARGMTNIS